MRCRLFLLRCVGAWAGHPVWGDVFLHRDKVAVRFVEVFAAVDTHHPERQGAFHFDPTGIDSLYASLKPAQGRLPERRVLALPQLGSAGVSRH